MKDLIRWVARSAVWRLTKGWPTWLLLLAVLLYLILGHL